jgi:hypothetical protein
LRRSSSSPVFTRSLALAACHAGGRGFESLHGVGRLQPEAKTVNGTSTFSASGKGSDGSTDSNHSTEHFNERPDGSVKEFFHCH